jgi:hypothetical protein
MVLGQRGHRTLTGQHWHGEMLALLTIELSAAPRSEAIDGCVAKAVCIAAVAMPVASLINPGRV